MGGEVDDTHDSRSTLAEEEQAVIGVRRELVHPGCRLHGVDNLPGVQVDSEHLRVRRAHPA